MKRILISASFSACGTAVIGQESDTDKVDTAKSTFFGKLQNLSWVWGP